MSESTIRSALPGDFDTVCEMVRALAREISAPVIPAITGSTLERLCAAEQPFITVFVAERDRGIVGIVICNRILSTWRGVEGLYIADLYVEPEARRLGIAADLLRHALRKSGARYLKLEVQRDNLSARAFYDRHGFEPNEEDATLFLNETGVPGFLAGG
jgi:ribosomal protein S18 acetylase RimI-like enzyme